MMVAFARSPGTMWLLLLAATSSLGQQSDVPQSQAGSPPLVVAPGGALLVAGGSVVVSSTFSQPGPVLYKFNLSLPSETNGWTVSVFRHSDTAVSVTGNAATFEVKRLYTATDQGRILVNDTITVFENGPAVAGVQVRHRAWSADPSLRITGVSGPNTLRASSCSTYGITGQLHTTQGYGTTVGLDAGTGGNPSVYGVFGQGGGSAIGVGMLALDDVFVAHSETANRAAPQDSFTRTRACLSLLSSPPSIELADPHFGLAAGDSHTLEWAVYTVAASEAGDDTAPSGYYSFVNRVRSDSGTSGRITIPKLGPMGAFQAGLLRTDNYSAIDWTKWTVAETRDIIRHNGIGHIISQMPRAESTASCGPLAPATAWASGCGSGFVNGNTSEWNQYFQALVAKVKAADPPVKVLIYFHAFISGERGASRKYRADRILNREMQQLNYSRCEAMPLFYPMHLPNGTSNLYGQELYKYLSKAKALGADGIYHDESGYSVIPYTFHADLERWDRRTVAFDSRLAVLPPPYLSSIPLLRLSYKVDFMRRVRDMMSAQVVANGQPMTRSYVVAQLASGQPAVHFAETSQQCRVKQAQLYTPVAMNRQPQDSADVDPRYNYTAGFRAASNVIPHLDFGALSMLGNHLVSNRTGMEHNIYQSMLPITVTDVGRGLVKGTDRIITSRSGTFGFNSTCACLELYGSDAALVKRWVVRGSQFEVRVDEGTVVVATPSSCKRCDSTSE